MKTSLTNHVQPARKAAGLTQAALADAAGVSRQTIIAIEKGNYVPSVLLAFTLADVLQQPVNTLFTISYEK